MSVPGSASTAVCPTSRRRRWVLVAVAVGLTLLALEGGARLVFSLTKRPRGIVFDDVVGWRMLPGLEKRGEEWCASVPARTNAAGYRDDEFVVRRAGAGKRIVALGDSFTYGQGVDFGERFSEYLEADRPGLEVLNFGVWGYATDQEVLVYERDARSHHPDVVLLMAFPFNDLEDLGRSCVHGWPKPYFRLADGRLDVVPPARSVTQRLRMASYLAEFAIGRLEPTSARVVAAESWAGRDTLPLFEALVARLRAAVEADGAQLLVVIIHPKNLRSKSLPKTRAAAEAASRAGAAVLDLHDAFLARDAEQDSLTLPNFHWSPAGHRLAATAIGEELRRRGWVD